MAGVGDALTKSVYDDDDSFKTLTHCPCAAYSLVASNFPRPQAKFFSLISKRLNKN